MRYKSAVICGYAVGQACKQPVAAYKSVHSCAETRVREVARPPALCSGRRQVVRRLKEKVESEYDRENGCPCPATES